MQKLLTKAFPLRKEDMVAKNELKLSLATKRKHGC
jgi:hypothetical protein